MIPKVWKKKYWKKNPENNIIIIFLDLCIYNWKFYVEFLLKSYCMLSKSIEDLGSYPDNINYFLKEWIICSTKKIAVVASTRACTTCEARAGRKKSQRNPSWQSSPANSAKWWSFLPTPLSKAPYRSTSSSPNRRPPSKPTSPKYRKKLTTSKLLLSIFKEKTKMNPRSPLSPARSQPPKSLPNSNWRILTTTSWRLWSFSNILWLTPNNTMSNYPWGEIQKWCLFRKLLETSSRCRIIWLRWSKIANMLKWRNNVGKLLPSIILGVLSISWIKRKSGLLRWKITTSFLNYFSSGRRRATECPRLLIMCRMRLSWASRWLRIRKYKKLIWILTRTSSWIFLRS